MRNSALVAAVLGLLLGGCAHLDSKAVERLAWGAGGSRTPMVFTVTEDVLSILPDDVEVDVILVGHEDSFFLRSGREIEILRVPGDEMKPVILGDAASINIVILGHEDTYVVRPLDPGSSHELTWGPSRVFESLVPRREVPVRGTN